MAQKKAEKNFMAQGAILGIASIVVRIIGLIYRIPLNNILGEKGVAYYGVAFEVYSILLLLSSYSLPLAVSKMVSARVTLGRYKQTRRLFIYCIFFALAVGIAAFCITFFGADLFARILNYPESAVAIKVLSFALVILSVLGVFRGFFQGFGSMVPTAFSNIVEQIVNAVISIAAALALYKVGADADPDNFTFENVAEAYGAAGGTLGTVLGALSALVFLVILFFATRRSFMKNVREDVNEEKEKLSDILKVLIATIIPVILSTTIYNLSGLINSGVFSNIMDFRGMDGDLIDTLTGMYTGNYKVIINVPIALASALSSSVIPSIVASRTRKEPEAVKAKIRSAIKVTMLIAIPSAVGIGVLAKPIMNLLFPTSVDPSKVSLMLMLGAATVVFYSLSTITNGILQGIDKMKLPVIHAAISLVTYVIVLIILLFTTDLNIFAVVFSDMLFSVMMCIMNHHSLRKHLGFKQEWKRTFVMPLICAAVMGVLCRLLYQGLYALIGSNAVSVIISIIFAIIVYALALVLSKTITKNELLAFPGGSRLYKVIHRLRLM